MIKLILMIALALVSTGAWGYVLLGSGNVGCGKFVADMQTGHRNNSKRTGWVMGFISGGNLERERNGGNSQIGKRQDPESITRWLENYCRANPLDDLSDATDALVSELKARVNK